MSNQLDKYHLYSITIRRLLLFTGMWPSINPSILYRLLPFVHGLAALLTSCAILNFCRHHFASINLFFKGLTAALSFFTGIQKTICVTFYRKRLVELHGSLAITFGQDLEDKELQPILLSPLLSFYRPSLVLSIVTFVVSAMYLFTPVLLIVIQRAKGTDVVKYLLPYPAVYPWQIDASSWLYPTHSALEVYAGTFLCAATISLDSLFGYYIFQISGQLRTLSHRIKTLSSSKNYRKVISECVARHEILTRCQGYLEQIYGPIVLWMLVTNAMIICALVYQVSKMSPGKAAHATFYIVLKSMQTLLYGWFGTFLTTENDKFRDAIYASDWPGSGEKCLMTDVFIMMTYKPFVLRACGLSTISVDMFVAVSNTALSYFFMLRTLEEAGHV